MHRKMNLTKLTCVLAMCAVTVPAVAQESNRNQQQDEQRVRQQDQQRQRARQQDRQRQREAQRARQRQQDQQQAQQGQQFRLRPSGWVAVAVDYDQDNRFDAVERIYYYDLVQARQRSAQRRGQQEQQQQMAGQDRSQRQQMARQDRRQRQQIRRTSGRVTDLTTVRLSDGQQHRLAKLETQQGQRVPVDLGRADQVQRFDIQEGDRIAVWGTRSRINDRPVLSARRIQTENEQFTVGRERDRNLKRVRGQIANLRTARFRGQDQQFRVAQIELNDGDTETVILGPQERLGNLNLQQGDDVRLLVRPGRLNDESVLIAEQVRANERTVRIERPDDRRLTSRQRGQD